MTARRRPSFHVDHLVIASTYTIVHRESMEPLPIATQVLEGTKAPAGMAWMAGMGAHQLTLRSTRPMRIGASASRRMVTGVRNMIRSLERFDACLLPGGAHPWLDPRQAEPWYDDRDPFHALPASVLDRQVHGHMNAPCLCLGVPFRSDEAFARLHAAARLLLPILPALTAASPILGGRRTGFLDARLEASLHTHENLPELMGSVIPEAVFSQDDHDRVVLGPIAKTLAGHIGRDMPDAEALNARGAVPYFDRGILELRVMEPQEDPTVDLAIAEFVAAVLNALCDGRWVSTYLQRAWSETDLFGIYLQVIKDAGLTLIANRDYLLMFGLLKQEQMSAGRLWQHLFVALYDELSEEARHHVGRILETGCLARRILEHTGREPDHESLRSTCVELAACLRDGRALTAPVKNGNGISA